MDNDNGGRRGRDDFTLGETLHEGSNPKIKEYGQKSIAPIVDLLLQYQGELNPYLSAIEKGLAGAKSALSGGTATDPNAKIEQTVSGWVQSASELVGGVRSHLSNSNGPELLEYLEAEATKRPGLLFATSYAAGLLLGRLGRHMARIRATGTTGTNPANQQQRPFGDQQIH